MKILCDCEEEFECSCVLSILAPLLFAYYFDAALASDRSEPAIWHIIITEYVVIADLHTPEAACDDASCVASPHLLVSANGCDFPVPGTSGASREVLVIGFLKIIHGGIFDPVTSSVVQHWSPEAERA